MAINVAIYARYSSALQNDRSIEDQITLCMDALRADEQVAEVFYDRAKSGVFAHNRDGLNNLLSTMQRGIFSIILTENLNRVSRCMEDAARIYKLARFHGVRIRTLSDGEISEMHVGFNSTVSAMQINQIREQTRRGQMGNIRAGKASGGLAYGYRVRPLNNDGRHEPGLREIDPEQAAVVHRIYDEYASGITVAAIVRQLNADGIPSPSGRLWARTTLLGHFDRKDGILQNSIYLGLLVWGRCPEVKHPVNAKRVIRVKAEAQWVTQRVPALQIIEDDLWHEVQRIRASTHKKHAPGKAFSRFDLRCICARCEASIQEVEQGYLMCVAAQRYHTCIDRRRYHIKALTERLHAYLCGLSPSEWQELVQIHTDAYVAAVRHLTKVGSEIEQGLDEPTVHNAKPHDGEQAMHSLQMAQAALARLPHPSSLSRRAFTTALRQAKTDEQKSLFVAHHLESVTLDHDPDGGIIIGEVLPNFATIAELNTNLSDA